MLEIEIQQQFNTPLASFFMSLATNRDIQCLQFLKNGAALNKIQSVIFIDQLTLDKSRDLSK